MGQKFGKLDLVEEFQPLIKLSGDAVIGLHAALKALSDNSCFKCNELAGALRTIQTELGFNGDNEVSEAAAKYFSVMDPTNVGEVDMLEFICPLVCMSTLTEEPALRVIFDAFDFDLSSDLSIDEMVLGTKIAIKGFLKFVGAEPLTVRELESIAMQAFIGADDNKDHIIQWNEFLNFCKSDPEISSWIRVFDDCGDPAFLAETDGPNAPFLQPALPDLASKRLHSRGGRLVRKRWETPATVLDSTLVVFGGRMENGSVSNELVLIDVGTGLCDRTVAEGFPPDARAHHGICTARTKKQVPKSEENKNQPEESPEEPEKVPSEETENVVVIFGGLGDKGKLMRDTYILRRYQTDTIDYVEGNTPASSTSSGSILGRTMEWVGPLATFGGAPSPRQDPCLAEIRPGLVAVFGGSNQADLHLLDINDLDKPTWAEVKMVAGVAPEPCIQPCIAAEPELGVAYIFGGTTSQGPCNLMYEVEVNAMDEESYCVDWTLVTPDSESDSSLVPSPRQGAIATARVHKNRRGIPVAIGVVVFGGSAGRTSTFWDTWHLLRPWKEEGKSLSCEWLLVSEDVGSHVSPQATAGGTGSRSPACFDSLGRVVVVQNLERANFMDSALVLWPSLPDDIVPKFEQRSFLNLNEEGSIGIQEDLVPIRACAYGEKPPWHAGLIKPDEQPEFSSRPPDVQLDLSWIFGFNCSQYMGNNLAYSAKTGELVFAVSRSCILVKRVWEEETGVWEMREVEQDPDDIKDEEEDEEDEDEEEEEPEVEMEKVWRTLSPEEIDEWDEEEHEDGEVIAKRKVLRWTQRHMLSHGCEIQALAVDAKQLTAATADSSATIILWDLESLKVTSVLKGFHRGRILKLAFSMCGNFVLSLSVDSNMNNSFCVYGCKNSRLMFSKPPDLSTSDCQWISPNCFVTVGAGPPLLWQRVFEAGVSPCEDLVFKCISGVYGRRMGKAPAALARVAVLPSESQTAKEVPETDAEGRQQSTILQSQFVTSTVSGSLHLWCGQNAVRSVRAHEGEMLVLEYHHSSCQLITGGDDGHIKLWTPDLECISDIDTLLHIPAVHSSVSGLGDVGGIHSACLSVAGGILAVATKAAAVVEIQLSDGSMVDGSPIVQGDHRGNIYAVAVHPSNEEFCTAGESAVLRVWSMEGNNQLRFASLPGPARVTAYNYSGHKLAVGLGGNGKDGQNHTSSGTLCIYKSKDLSVIQRFQDCREPILDIKWSEEGDRLAMVTGDGFIFVYKTKDWSFRAKIQATQQPLRALDLSMDGAYVRVMTADHQLLYFSVRRTALVSKDLVAEAEWLTDSCPVGYNVQGLWPKPLPKIEEAESGKEAEDDSSAVSGTGDETLYLEEYTAILKPDEEDEEPKPLLIASGAVDGTIHLRNYPSLRLGSQSTPVKQHTGNVTALVWTKSGDYLISVGGSDRSILKWKVNMIEELDEEEVGEEPPLEEEKEDGEEEEEEDDEKEEEGDSPENEEKKSEEVIAPEPPPKKKLKRSKADLADGEVWERDEATKILKSDDRSQHRNLLLQSGKGMMTSSKPSESGPPPNPPNVHLELDWVYGYSGQVNRNAVFYNSRGQVVFPAGVFAVVVGNGRGPMPSRGSQRFLAAHTEEITAMCPHPAKDLVASAQIGEPVRIHIWSSVTQAVQHSLALPVGAKAVSAMAFSWDGSLLAISSLDSDHTIFVYYWREGILKCTAAGGAKKVLTLAFTPEGTLLQGGVGHFHVWTLSASSMTCMQGGFAPEGSPQNVTSSGFIRPVPEGEEEEEDEDEEEDEGEGNKPPKEVKIYDPVPVMGTQDGSVYRIEGRKVLSATQAHEGPITCMWSHLGGLITGSEDGTVKLWSHSLEEVASITLAELLNADQNEEETQAQLSDHPRSLCLAQDGETILLATKFGYIYELYPAEEGYDVHGSAPLLDGPGSHDICCVASHPHSQEFCTVNNDGKLHIWSTVKKKEMRHVSLVGSGRSVAYSPSGTRMAVALVRGLPLEAPDDPELGSEENEENEQDDEPKPTGTGTVVMLQRRDLQVLKEFAELPALPTCISFAPDGLTLAVGLSDGQMLSYTVSEEIIVPPAPEDPEEQEVDEQKGEGSEDEEGSQVADKPPPPPLDPPEVKFDVEAKPAFMAFEDSEVRFLDFTKDSQFLRVQSINGDLKYFEVATGAPVPKPADNWNSHSCTNVPEVEGILPLLSLESLNISSLDHAYLQDMEVGVVAFGNHLGAVNLGRFPCDLGSIIEPRLGHPPEQDVLVKFISSGTSPNTMVSIGKEDRCIVQWKMKSTPVVEDNSVIPFRPTSSHDHICFYTQGKNIINLDDTSVKIFNKESRSISPLINSTPVTTVAISLSKRYMAVATTSMQTAKKCPDVKIWDLCVPEEICSLSKFHLTKIKGLCFSKDSKYLAVTAGPNNLTAIFHSPTGSWKDSFILTSFPTSTAKLWFASHGQSAQELFVFGGEGFFLVCDMVTGHRISSRNSSFKPMSSPQNLLCGVPSDRHFITGCASGDILLWVNGALNRIITGHEDAVISVSHMNTSGRTITSSLDWNLKIWSPVFALEKTICMQTTLGTFTGTDDHILTCQFCDDKKALVKITHGEVFEISLTSSRCTKLFP